MRHKITIRTELLVRELDALADQIERGLLAAASREARREWRCLRRQRPSEAELAMGSLALSEDELAFMVAKARRFKAILETLGGRRVRRTAAPEHSAAA